MRPHREHRPAPRPIAGRAVLGVLIAAILSPVACRDRDAGDAASKNAESSAAAARATIAVAHYHCPMHPTMTSDRPGACPICGMAMVPTASPPGGGMAPAPGAALEGRVAVSVPAVRQQRVGVRTEEVRRRPFRRTLRAAGRVVPDETHMHHVHTKVEGWVETLHVNATGTRVVRGQPLLEIYSPELLATQEEFLLALRARGAAPEGGAAGTARPGDALVESTRRRLLLFDLTPGQIDALETSGKATRTVAMYAPISGWVTERNVTQGQKIGPETTLLDIADLSRVWVIASIYEYELPFVKVGQPGVVTLAYLPGAAYRGRVTLIAPTLDPTTRTVPVRLEFANPGLELKPEMFAEVRIESDLGERLAVPDSAVLASGERNLVFVAEGEGGFAPREVRLGVRLPDSVEVLDGLKEGERIVTSGTFFIDSESRLQAALAASERPPGESAPARPGDATPPPPAGDPHR